MEISTVVIIAVIALCMLGVGVAVGFFVRKSFVERTVEGGKELARTIKEAAKKDAESIVKEAKLQAKERLYQSKVEFDKESVERTKELKSLEKRLESREGSLDKKFEVIDRKDSELSKREKNLGHQEKKVSEAERSAEDLIRERKEGLERISSMSSEEAKNQLLEAMEAEAKHDAAKILKRIDEETRAEADMNSKKILSTAIQRYAGEYVAERTVSVVNLPSDEMKGRIIGREGRNIRAIEAATGIDIIIDDTPEAVILSGHNPIRREVAKHALEKLISDGRIHPARIEEVVKKVEEEVEQSIMEAGKRAVFDTGIHGVNPEIQKLIGRLKYRYSYAQNVYAHSMEVAFICGVMAAELGLSTKQARRAGLLHDIGKAVDHEVEGPHAAIGGELAKKYGESAKIVAAVAEHHNDNPSTIMGVLVQAADTLSAARPGARREMLESYVKRLDDLEKIAKSFNGVEKSHAMQAGRDIRVIVSHQNVTDEEALVISKDIAKKIEEELSYPGQIRVTVIRETRAVAYAK
ncbi:MAG: ribonuclease Y [Thermodesulfobacteriota bacterium]